MTRTTISIFSILLLVSGVAWAQVITGTISGTVSDETGAVLPGVEVIVTNTDTSTGRTVVTDDAGRYSAPSLSLGNYEVQAGLTGFQTGVRSGIKLTVGREAIVDIQLSIGAISERVVVEGEAPLVESTTSTVTGLVDDKQIRDLPLNGRSFTELAALQQGVVVPRHFENGQPGNEGEKLSIGGTRVTQTAFLMDSTDIRNHYGTTPGSVAGVLLGVETVREFSVVTTGASAEYGLFTGGVINAVSRSGTNQFHGSVFEFHRNSALHARNFFDRNPGNPTERSKPPHFVRNQFGFTLGGPIVQDKTFFFGSYEALRDRLTITRTARVPTQNMRDGIFPNGTFNFLTGQVTTQIPVSPTILPFLAAYPLPNGATFSDETGFFSFEDAIPTNEDYFMIKVDHSFTDNHSIFVRYTLDDSDKNPFLYSGIGPTGRGFEEFSTTRFQVATIKDQIVISPTLLNEFTVGFMRSNIISDSRPIIPVTEDQKQMDLPDRTFGTVAPGGGLQNWGPSELTHLDQPLNRFEFADNMVWTKGRHSIKFGGKITRLQFNILNGIFAHGVAVFVAPSNFLQAQPLVFLSKLGDIDPPGELPPGFERNVGGPLMRNGYRETIFGFFVQDDFKWTPNLTMNMGLRYEFYKNPTEVGGRVGDLADNFSEVRLGNPVLSRNPSLSNFAPRIGLAWDPFGDGKMSIRAAGGIFYELMETGRLFGPQTQFPFHSKVTVPFPKWPNFLDSVRDIGIENFKDAPFTFGTPNQSYVVQYNLTIQRELFPDTVVTVGYAGSRGIALSRLVDVNVAPQTVKDGRYFWPAGSKRTNQAFDQHRQYLWDANSFYNSLKLGLRKRFGDGYQLQTGYSWSKSVDDGSNTANFDAVGTGPNGTRQTGFDRKVDRSRSSFDIRHAFSTNFTYELPLPPGMLTGGWQVSGLLTLSTGGPITPRTSFDSAGMDNGSDIAQRPDLVGDNNPVLNDGREPEQYFDINAFALPPTQAADGTPGGFWGTAGRGTIDGPGVATFDLGVVKETGITEEVNLQFRVEFFNIFNRSNFSFPNGTIFTSPGPPTGAGAAITTTSTTARQIQLALKLTF